jgi:adenosylcobyric acid synthase
MLGAQSDGIDHDAKVDDALNAIAAELEHHLDVDGLLKLAMGQDDA